MDECGCKEKKDEKKKIPQVPPFPAAATAWVYSTWVGLSQARSASDGHVPSLALRAWVNSPRDELTQTGT
jgi:hypothetical protein